MVLPCYPLVMANSLRTGKWPIEIMDLAIENMVDLPIVM